MIPPTSIPQKSLLLAISTLLPLTLVGACLPQPAAQARQQSLGDSLTTRVDGVYLYGNSPQPNQPAHHYIVFERHRGKVVGAFYSPQSEFTCFTGAMQGERLEVEVLVPEEPEAQGVTTQLTRLYPLQGISANDRRMLTVCRQVTIALSNPR